ncbi:MAG TPA: FISUMP domain-containing protein [Chitinophagales bacterium]|nr:FISUMP domain-containing protein [Chitinophagales bacterium]
MNKTFPIALLFIFILNSSMISGDRYQKITAQDFPSITIGNQTWMTTNWEVRTSKSFYFDNDSITNKKYGRLYYFSNALAAAPPGWHLPSLDEWQTLINHFGGDEKALTALLDGGSSGLNLLYGGNKSANISPTDIYNFKDEWGFYWTSTTDADQTAYAIHFEKGNNKIIKQTYRRANGFSVRYVKDAPKAK